VQKFFDDYKAKYGEELSSSYPINGYDMATVFKQAIEKAGSTDAAKMVDAMETMGKIKGINSEFQFSKECHRPVGQSRIILKWTKGQGEYQDTASAQEIPDIGDSNPCAGKQDAG
jgi:branched-chain amino acid transport system substrate-binding protein